MSIKGGMILNVSFEDGIPISTTYHSTVLHRLATKAYERMSSAASDQEARQDDAILAVVCSAAALEAFINEAADIANSTVRNATLDKELDPHLDRLAAFAGTLDEAERGFAPIRLKYLLAYNILTGKTYDKGSSPYQDFDLLIKLRDSVMHMRPVKTKQSTTATSREENLAKQLADRKLCAAVDKSTMAMPWLMTVATRGVARWACNVAVHMSDSIRDKMIAISRDATPPGFDAIA